MNTLSQGAPKKEWYAQDGRYHSTGSTLVIQFQGGIVGTGTFKTDLDIDPVTGNGTTTNTGTIQITAMGGSPVAYSMTGTATGTVTGYVTTGHLVMRESSGKTKIDLVMDMNGFILGPWLYAGNITVVPPKK